MIFTGWDRDRVGEGSPHRMYANVGGEWHEVKPLSFIPTISEKDLQPDMQADMQTVALATYIARQSHGHLRQRRMSRKRFIKLLMSRRIPRDYSTILADHWHKFGVPYSSAWLYMDIFCFSDTY